jgi:hypothetical protein
MSERHRFPENILPTWRAGISLTDGAGSRMLVSGVKFAPTSIA